MIKLITGEKGTGKTKIMLDMMNEATATSNGSLVCIEKGSNLRTQINYKIRWCDTEFYKVDGFEVDLSKCIVVNSKISYKKYKLFNISVIFLVLALLTDLILMAVVGFI